VTLPCCSVATLPAAQYAKKASIHTSLGDTADLIRLEPEIVGSGCVAQVSFALNDLTPDEKRCGGETAPAKTKPPDGKPAAPFGFTPTRDDTEQVYCGHLRLPDGSEEKVAVKVIHPFIQVCHDLPCCGNSRCQIHACVPVFVILFGCLRCVCACA